jgi:hypothetical protein
MKMKIDYYKEIDRKNKEIHDLSNNTTKDIDGAWTSAYDVKVSREKHTGLLESIDKSTRTKYTGSITSFTTVKRYETVVETTGRTGIRAKGSEYFNRFRIFTRAQE